MDHGNQPEIITDPRTRQDDVLGMLGRVRRLGRLHSALNLFTQFSIFLAYCLEFCVSIIHLALPFPFEYDTPKSHAYSQWIVFAKSNKENKPEQNKTTGPISYPKDSNTLVVCRQ